MGYISLSSNLNAVIGITNYYCVILTFSGGCSIRFAILGLQWILHFNSIVYHNAVSQFSKVLSNQIKQNEFKVAMKGFTE